MSQFEAVLFDFNGVIVDDEKLHEAAFRELLRGYGEELSHEEYLFYFAGRTDAEGFEVYARRRVIELPLERLLTQKHQCYLKAADGARPYPGVDKLLVDLSERGRNLALVTASSRVEVDGVLPLLGLGNVFPVLVTADDVSAGKPDPEGYLMAAKLLGVDPAKCLVVEDSPSGIRAAKAAGAVCWGIASTHKESELRQADRVLASIEELKARLA